jgi:hypothetical protein
MLMEPRAPRRRHIRSWPSPSPRALLTLSRKTPPTGLCVHQRGYLYLTGVRGAKPEVTGAIVRYTTQLKRRSELDSWRLIPVRERSFAPHAGNSTQPRRVSGAESGFKWGWLRRDLGYWKRSGFQ